LAGYLWTPSTVLTDHRRRMPDSFCRACALRKWLTAITKLNRVSIMTDSSDLLKSRFHVNMDRITGLVKLIHSDIDSLRPTDPLQSEGARADILRAITVFLHATFEDVLRTTARERLPNATTEVLDNIPLVGTSQPKSPREIFLGCVECTSRKVSRRFDSAVRRASALPMIWLGF